jgi:pimeloyl-ACP methyl ester carboxylesterase
MSFRTGYRLLVSCDPRLAMRTACICLGLSISAAAMQSEDLPSQAKTLVTWMAMQQFSKVEAHFDSTMAAVLPASKLSAAWNSVIAEAGDFKTILDTRQDSVQGYRVVYVSCRFAERNLDVKLVFDAKDQVAGLFFVPAKTQAATATPGKNSVKAEDVAGDWIGAIDIGAMKLRIVFHITSTPDGLKATIDSPDQNAADLPVSSVQLNGSALKLESEKLNALYEGNFSSDLGTLDGTWKQGVLEQPLVLNRVKDKAQLAPRLRPQEPRKPYPYREEDVFYDNKAQGNKLAATLTIPSGKGPFPAVVLITGSGPQDRNESLLGHKPFLVLSDYLTRKGIAVLRADDRGVGKSTGEFSGATTADFATDTEAGIAWLKTRPEVNPKMIGLIGHSEGGIIAPMVAARNPDVAFIVMLAGSGVPGDEIIVSQAELLAEAAGQSHEQAMKAAQKQRRILNVVKQDIDDAALDKQLHEELAGEMSDAQIGAIIQQLNIRWLRYFITYDPATALRKVSCPVLALNGAKDMQVPPKQNLPAIRKALEAAGNKNFEVDELPGLNHLFQTAKTGAPSEYSEIEETMSPVVLEKITTWILKLNH